MTTIGGVGGAALGAAVTYGYAQHQGWAVTVPFDVMGGAVLVALVLGTIAGIYPAARAALMHPADAVRPPA